MREWSIGKDFKGSGRGIILRCFPGIRLDGLRKTTKPLSQDSRSPSRDLNPVHPKYETGILTTRPRSSVTVNHISPVHILAYHFFKVHLNIILHLHLSLSSDVSSDFQPKFCTHFASIPCLIHTPIITFSLILSEDNHIWCRVQVTKFLIIPFYSASSYLPPLGSKYSPRHSVFKHIMHSR
jgi:hypothetical protein